MFQHKIFIYQLLPRLFGNSKSKNKYAGTITENGCGKFDDISVKALSEIRKAGFTHVWFTGVLAHASQTDYTTYGIPKQFPEIVKGRAGSPYAIRDYYDVDPDLAIHVGKRMEEFDALITRTKKNGLKSIIDFVPNHLARDYCSLAKPKETNDFGEEDDRSVAFSPNNNFYYLPNEPLRLNFIDKKVTYAENPAKVTGNDCFSASPSQYDWYETVKLNYGIDYQHENRKYFTPIPDTWLKMKAVLLSWANRKIDGFRCDMAEMVPIEFWQWVIPQVKKQFPDIVFIAEIYNPAEYRNFLSNNTFDYLYDKVGLYDVLRDVTCGYRPASDITFTLNRVGDIQSKMLNFMENHDEQRIASDFFAKNGDYGRASMIVSACVNVNPVMVYFGQELGEHGMDEEGYSGKDGRTTIFDYWSVDAVCRWNNNGKWNTALLTTHEKALKQFYTKLLNLCNRYAALREGLFYDLMPANYENPAFDSTKQYAFLRGVDEELMLIVVNFTQAPVAVAVNIPAHAYKFFKVSRLRVEGVLTPLLSKKSTRVSFNENGAVAIKIKACSGEIFKISFL